MCLAVLCLPTPYFDAYLDASLLFEGGNAVMKARTENVSSSDLSSSEELVKSLRKIDEVMEAKNFAEAGKDKSIDVCLEELNKFKEMLKREGDDVTT